ncbi:MAG TPA: TatD family hydrolase [Bacteroidales bacterium]|nr:TatD family hydrolase [Bacteroidales bacterium]HRZ47965.1 TatD family hydrolase [Bacteroidales bacterium]
MHFVNAHTHRIPCRDEIAVVNLDKDAREVPAEGYWSVGIHPWHICADTLEEELQRLEFFLTLPQVVAVGECGLDRLAKAPWPLQLVSFEKQLDLARKYQKPVIIHNVRSAGELLQIRKRIGNLSPWLLHGFHGSQREAELFLQQGCYLGFGKHLFNSKSKAAVVCAMAPIDRILPETDASEITVTSVIEKIAAIKEIPVSDMLKQLLDNFRRLFVEDHFKSV